MINLAFLPTAYIITIFPALMIFAAVGDAISMKITNRLVMILTASFFIGAFLVQMPVETLFYHVLAGIGMYFLGFLLFCLRLSGGGDFKLLSAVTLWLGPSSFFTMILFTSLAGAVLVGFVLFARQYPIPVALRKHFEFFEIIATDCKYVPYGIAICTGALLTYKQSFWFESLSRFAF